MPCAKTKAITLIALLMCAGCEDATHSAKRAAIEKAFAAEMQRYPEARLIDIYKFFFQGAFGPGHMIPDTAAARRYLARELAEAARFDSILWHPAGHQQEYHRFNLKAVRDGKIAFADLLEAFIESANATPAPAAAEWRKEWRAIMAVIEKHCKHFPDFEADRARLEEMLARGEFVAHHSAVFEEKYQPHYRVIHRRHFEKLGKNLQ